MLEAEQDSEQNPAVKESGLLACENNRQHEDSVEETIVLEVDVVDNEQPGREENRETGNMGKVLAS